MNGGAHLFGEDVRKEWVTANLLSKVTLLFSARNKRKETERR